MLGMVRYRRAMSCGSRLTGIEDDRETWLELPGVGDGAGVCAIEARPKKLVEYPEADAIDLQNRALAATNLGQSELFPLEKPKPAAFQLRLPGF
jgi:hypothetical protein